MRSQLKNEIWKFFSPLPRIWTMVPGTQIQYATKWAMLTPYMTHIWMIFDPSISSLIPLSPNHVCSGYMLSCSGLREKGVKGIISRPNCLVWGHLTIRLNAMLQAESLKRSQPNFFHNDIFYHLKVFHQCLN